MGGCFSARMLAEHEEMRFHPDLSLFVSPLDVWLFVFFSVQVAVVVVVIVVVLSNDTLRKQTGNTEGYVCGTMIF